MRLHIGIRDWVRRVLMTKPNLNVRFSPDIIDQMDKLVNEGRFVTKADLINQAVIEFLHRDGMRVLIQEEIRKMMGK